MDWASLLTGLKDSLPEMGLGGVILWFLILRENAMKGDRDHYRSEREEVRQHFTKEIERLQQGRGTEIGELEKQINSLRRENETLEDRLDHERDRRRTAEDRVQTQEETVQMPRLPKEEP